MIGNGVGDFPDELVVSEMCEAYGCTPRQWREEFSLHEQRTFWHIQQCKIAKRNQDRVKLPEGTHA